jgi:peptidoglycan-associated lipoprotein
LPLFVWAPPHPERRQFQELHSMKPISTTLRFTAVSAVLVLAACTTKPEATATQAPPVATQPAPPAPAPVTSSVIPGSAEDFRVNVRNTVNFDLDRYDIREGDKAILQRQAAWLARYPNVRLTIEGHADERGTREYNLALGARRANSVREYLASLGTASGRLETVSYGKERPVCTDANESCWAQNRRGVSAISGGAGS